MNRLHELLERTSQDLNSMGVDWCLVGGLAVSVWGEPRLTRDIDVVVAVDDDREAERMIRELSNLGYEIQEIVEQEATGRVATVRFGSRAASNGVVLDVLFASAGIESEIVEGAVLVEVFEGLEVPVAPRAHLIVMKLLARDDRHRPMDADDIRSLLKNAELTEIETARRLVGLVQQRGYGRGRDLLSLLEEAVKIY